LPTRNTSIVMSRGRHARRCRHLRRSGSIPFRGGSAEPRPRGKVRAFVRRAVSADHARRRKLERRAAPARRGCRGSAAAASHGVVAAAGSTSTHGSDLRADRASVAAVDFEPDSCVPQLASSDDLADAVGDHWPARDVLPRVPITRYPTISPKSPPRSKSGPQTAHRSPIGSASLSALYRRVLHARHLKCRIGGPS
jgi:hypothetical protein